ncbi:histidinol-phosphate transaminase [Epilithonimonas ginsengisoli]|uniref:Histidinol-phosphate aminotransferase n=1 Tax=Epilithonimonas ginsengisoli TaxID=1245592 RepID=A0ABU4JCX8_9FLAO|nr:MULTISPECIES: histidinol-phosphate transaminase [Chryseobacterium group]MBV6878246.1 histidinol-phosphate transaminase [Epilithonimonas sp. FP105]MDW8547513.1 histidinol-phosphate transaminase [Epilithonimonas ginsengisoli]OAH68900.1 histidinol phosphate aminotransferase [Chryseobacterium sp. FP211-J200]
MKIDIQNLVRKNILELKPYSSARDEFEGENGIFLDANENPFGELNRYPDPYQRKIKEKLSELNQISAHNIFLGNGSDEVIDLAFRIFCEPGKDKVLTFSPTYGMYEVSANINNVELVNLDLNEDFQIDLETLKPYLNDENLKIIFICSPNNPTGNSIKNIKYILENFNGIVFIDEAYIDFSPEESFRNQIKKYPNLIVSQTFSKAWGMASVRVGIAYASDEIIRFYNKTKPPYNISQLNQNAVLDALNDENIKLIQDNIKLILNEKKLLIENLEQLELVKKIYPTDANFVLIEVGNADLIYKKLVEENVIIRNRNSVIKNCLRITVGSPEENLKLIEDLKSIT